MSHSFLFCFSRKRARLPPKVNTLLGEERDGSQHDSDDIYVRRMWHDCQLSNNSNMTLTSQRGTAGIYGRAACHAHPMTQHVCGGDYTQMLELKCTTSSNTPPPQGIPHESQYGHIRQVKFIDPAAQPALITYPSYKSSDGLYDPTPVSTRQSAILCCNSNEHYALRTESNPDLLSPDKQPDVVQINGVSKSNGEIDGVGTEPSDNIRNLQQWLEDHSGHGVSVKRQESGTPIRNRSIRHTSVS